MSTAMARVLPFPNAAGTLAAQYIAGADTDRGRNCRRQVTQAFAAAFGDFGSWLTAPVEQRLCASLPVRGYAAWAAVNAGVAVCAEYVVASRSKWGLFLGDKYPQTEAVFRTEAASLGFDTLEIDKM